MPNLKDACVKTFPGSGVRKYSSNGTMKIIITPLAEPRSICVFSRRRGKSTGENMNGNIANTRNPNTIPISHKTLVST
jgi:hypothetical protein